MFIISELNSWALCVYRLKMKVSSPPLPSPPLKLVHTLQVVRALYCVKKQFDNGQKVALSLGHGVVFVDEANYYNILR